MSLVGVEGIHAWTPPDAVAAAIELNRRVAADGKTPVFPRYVVRHIAGLDSLGDPDATNDPRVGADHEIPRSGNRRGKTTTYEGSIIARTRSELRAAAAAMRSAFKDISAEGTMTTYLHEANIEAPYSRFYNARALALEIDDTIKRKMWGGWTREFVIAFRWSDPRYFSTATGGGAVTITNTNTSYSFT